MKRLLLLAAALVTPATGQSVKVSALPSAGALTGTEAILIVQAGATKTASPTQLQTFLAPAFQSLDADLTAIAALGTTPFGRSILTATDAPALRSTLGLGANATDSTSRVPTSLTISTAAPLAGGGALTGNLALSITPASSGAAGTMSAADKAKLDGIAAGATANLGTVTSVAATVANGVTATVTNATTTPSIAIGLGAITPTSVASVGAVSGTTASFTGALSASNFSGSSSGANTGDQTSVTGNAGTATALQTGRTIALTGDVAYVSPSFNGAANVSATATLAASGVTAGTYGSAASVPIPTIDAKGRVTSITTAALGTMATQNATGVAITGGTATLTSETVSNLLSVSGSGTFSTTSPGLSLFGANVSYKIGFDGVAGTRGYIRYNVDTADNIHGHVFSAGAPGSQTDLWLIFGNGLLTPATDNTNDIGASANRVRSAYAAQFRPGSGAPIWTSGTGTPLGNVTAPVGSLYTRTDGGTGTTLYVKESATDATGWVAK